MAFSLRAKRKSEIDLIETTPKAFLGVAIPVGKQLNWEVDSISENKVSFATPFFFPTGGEEVTIEIDGEQKASITSKNVAGIFPFELGRNAENIRLYLEGYAQLFDVAKVEVFEQRFDEVLSLWKNKKD